jgi:hypothetical protein
VRSETEVAKQPRTSGSRFYTIVTPSQGPQRRSHFTRTACQRGYGGLYLVMGWVSGLRYGRCVRGPEQGRMRSRKSRTVGFRRAVETAGLAAWRVSIVA